MQIYWVPVQVLGKSFQKMAHVGLFGLVLALGRPLSARSWSRSSHVGLMGIGLSGLR